MCGGVGGTGSLVPGLMSYLEHSRQGGPSAYSATTIFLYCPHNDPLTQTHANLFESQAVSAGVCVGGGAGARTDPGDRGRRVCTLPFGVPRPMFLKSGQDLG